MGGGPLAPEDARIFRYVVRVDLGGTPNPYGGWCSMAVCKPDIRRTARVGDWIVGLRSKRNDEVVSAMRVDEMLGFAEYWRDPRFRAKRPGRCTLPDNIYRPLRDGTFAQVANPTHDASDVARDLRGRHVLVSWRYWYFGDRSPALPGHLAHLVHSNQGHSLDARRRPYDVGELETWLSDWAPGIHGRPIDERRSSR